MLICIEDVKLYLPFIMVVMHFLPMEILTIQLITPTVHVHTHVLCSIPFMGVCLYIMHITGPHMLSTLNLVLDHNHICHEL